jgi:effector-binding domain-containing protein
VHHGPYDGLPAAWGALMTWVGEQGHEPAADLWEVYAVGAETTADPGSWRTELYRPLARRA